MKQFLQLMVLTGFLFQAGCGVDKEKGILMAAGPYGDLAVVISDENLRPGVQQFLSTFNQDITFVIKPEPLYQVDVLGPDNWELAKAYKNSLFIVRLGDGGPVEKNIRKEISREALDNLSTAGGGVVKLNEPWATYQLAILVVSPDRNTLTSILRRKTEKIRDLLAEGNRERILRRSRYEGLRTDLMSSYWQNFGFLLEIPKTFEQNQLKPDGYPAVELMRTGPSQGVTISWHVTPDPLGILEDKEALVALRQEMGDKVHNEGLVPETLSWSTATLDGLECPKLTGAWNSNAFAGGGAFWCYFVPDVSGGRVFCVDCLAFAPGMDKLPLFRHMEAMVSTFSTHGPRS